MYFHAWNNPNDGPESPWGAGAGPTRYARFDGLQPNTDYIVSCLFDKDATQKLRIYVNGQLGQRAETGTCGLLYSHSGAISLGGMNGSALYHDGSSSSNRNFNGFIAEMIHFTDAPISETRRRILENYFAKKYDIALTTGQTVNLGTGYDLGVAGIGQLNTSAGEVHVDSQGKSILRVKSPSTISNNSFLMWGHNDVPLEEIWPWSGGYLPTGIIERSGMVWNFDRTGTVSGVEVLINYSSLANANAFLQGDLKLLIHTNSDGQDFNGATMYNASALMSGNVVKFTNVDLPNGSFMALGNSSSITPLPIELISFNAELKGTYVDLSWETATEINNDYFVIERAGEDLDWEAISTVIGAGNSNSLLTYSDKDREPRTGLSYYRLKQVDFNGEYTYSDPVTIFNNVVITSADVFLYPNPSTNGSVFLKLPLEARDFPTNIRLFDLSGKLLLSEPYLSNSDVHELKHGDLIPGIYLVQISSSMLNETKKLVVK